MTACSASLAMSTSTGPGRPVEAMWNASAIVRGISAGSVTRKLCLVIGIVMPRMSASWKASVPIAGRADLAGDGDHRHRVHVGVGDRGDQVGRARAGGRHADADLAGGLRRTPRRRGRRPARGGPGCGARPSRAAGRTAGRIAARCRRPMASSERRAPATSMGVRASPARQARAGPRLGLGDRRSPGDAVRPRRRGRRRQPRSAHDEGARGMPATVRELGPRSTFDGADTRSAR